MKLFALTTLTLASSSLSRFVDADIIINEISSSGTFNTCGGTDILDGEDYVELYNTETDVTADGFNLTGYTMFDNSGIFDDNTYEFDYTFPLIMPNEYVVMCKDFPGSFEFGIGSTDTVTLSDPNGQVVSRAGPLTGFGDEFNTYQYNSQTESYEYAIPTPGEPNDQFVGLELFINEVSTGPISTTEIDICGGDITATYIELINVAANPANLNGFELERVSGVDGSVATSSLPAEAIIDPFRIVVLCSNSINYDFSISTGDTITLKDRNGNVVTTTGPLTGVSTAITDPNIITTYNLKMDDTMEYLPSLPTPGEINVFPSPLFETILINEAANDGTYNTCDGDDVEAGEDYIELYNNGNTNIDLTGWILHDDQGADDSDAYVFGSGGSEVDTPVPSNILSPGEFLLLCGDFPNSFQFGIGSSDTISLLDSDGLLVSTTGKLKGLGSETNTYQYNPEDGGSYGYSIPSPGESNTFLGQAQLLITEVSQTGIADVCVTPTIDPVDGSTIDPPDGTVGSPYVEFYNYGGNPYDMGGYKLQNTAGISYTFPADTKALPLRYRLICLNDDPTFTISETDLLTLIDDENEIVTSMTSSLLASSNTPTSSFQLKGRLGGLNPVAIFDLETANTNDYKYVYNSPPSPEKENVFLSAKYGGVLYINEVSSSGTYNACGGAILRGVSNAIAVGDDFIELYNSGTETIDMTGFLIYDSKGPDDEDATLVPEGVTLGPGEYMILCEDVHFPFGIGGTDTVTILDDNGDQIAVAGPLPGSTTVASTFQRDQETGEFIVGAPSPGSENDPTGSLLVKIYEVAPRGSIGSDTCSDGEDWVEIFNEGFQPIDISGFVISHTDNAGETYTFPDATTMESRAFLVLCAGTLGFDIGDTDSLSLARGGDGKVTSTSTPVGDGADGSVTLDVGVTWAVFFPSPFEAFYKYTVDATPGAYNVFTYVASTKPIQECGVQTEGYPGTDEYNLQELLNFGDNPEYSGGSFYGGSCTHFLNGDEGSIYELKMDGEPGEGTITPMRTMSIRGGTRDTEGSCFWVDTETKIPKMAILDEGARSFSICDVPDGDDDTIIYRDSPTNCMTLQLPEEVIADELQTSSDPNEGFEGIACDPANGKIYVAQEKDPRRVFTVDVESGVFDILIDIENNDVWSDLVPNLSGMAFDAVKETLYILSRGTSIVVETDLQGNIIGTPLDVSMAEQPEGIYFVPSTGEMVIVGEPNEIMRFSTDPPPPTSAPTSESDSVSDGAINSPYIAGSAAAFMASMMILVLSTITAL